MKGEIIEYADLKFDEETNEKIMGNPLSLIYGQGVLLNRMYFEPSYLTTTLRKWGLDKFKVAILGCGLVN